jgi:hypothetical protein
MSAAAPEQRCVVVVPLEKRLDAVYTGVLEPAVKAARLHPQPAEPARSQREREQLCEQIGDAAIVLVDARSPDPFCWLALGIAEAASRPVLAVVEPHSRNELPLELEHEEVIELDHDSGQEQSARDMQNAIAERLMGAQREVGQPSRRSAPSMSGNVVTPSDISQKDADALINAMLTDGLSPATVREELLRAGVPASWVDTRLLAVRLGGRPGW